MKAFPVVYMDYIPSDENRGMDLRDYFAAKAMQGIVGREVADKKWIAEYAKNSYEIADAMMKAREQ